VYEKATDYRLKMRLPRAGRDKRDDEREKSARRFCRGRPGPARAGAGRPTRYHARRGAQAREVRARAREQRELARERRIAEHVSRDKERRLTQPPLRARGLTRAEIVDAAIAVADAEGTEAVTMRRIARELGVGAMSLYWHVRPRTSFRCSCSTRCSRPRPSCPGLAG